MCRVVDVGALLQHEAGVEEQLPDVEEDGLQLLRGPVHEIAESGDRIGSDEVSSSIDFRNYFD